MKITRRALFAGVAAAAIAPPAQPMARPMTTGGYVGPGRWGLVGERGPTFIGFDLGSRESFTAMAKVVATPNGALLREITVIDSQQVRP